MATPIALTALAGETEIYPISLTGHDGVTPVSLSGTPTITFLAKRQTTDPDAGAVISKTLAGTGIAVVSASLGQITLTLAAADTAAIGSVTTLYCSVKVVSGAVETIGANGTLAVSPDSIQAV